VVWLGEPAEVPTEVKEVLAMFEREHYL
jgi:hypothetical protein